jgi:hypothetical protein
MATRRSSAATNEADIVFIYMVGVEVLKTVTHVRFDPSVHSIPPHAFAGCRDLIEVELNEALVELGQRAFQNCTSLLRIKIPPRVIAIGDYAFYGCTSLSVVELSEALEMIQELLFWNCTSLLSIKIPPKVTSIDTSAFQGCTSLSVVELNEAVDLGRCAFLNCTSLRSIKIPSYVTSIQDYTFSGCTSLSQVEMSEALVEIWQSAFSDCSSLTTIKIPPNVTTISDEAFNGCGSLIEVYLNNVLNTLGEDAFSRCIYLPFIEIPGSITMVSSGTFYNCISLKMVFLNEGTTLIDEDAFGHCDTLLGITIPSTVNSIALDAFYESNLLRNVSISPASNLTQEIFEQSLPTLSNMDITLDMIMHRFDKLPLHKYCYDYYSFHEEQQLEGFKHQVARLSAYGLQQDCLGMTPLHILACSSNGRGIEDFQCMIDKYPNALLIEDRWGDLPLNYALYAEARIEVINFLFKTHRQMWGDMPFDFGHMILHLGQITSLVGYVRYVIWAQRTHFPGLRVDWQSLVNTCIVDQQDIAIGIFRVFVEASLSSRYICTCEEHQSIIDARLREIDDEMGEDEDEDYHPSRYFVEIRDLVTIYVGLYHGLLLRITTILELALWKAVIFRSRNDNQQLTRVECRADAGRCAEVVIKLVLTFL